MIREQMNANAYGGAVSKRVMVSLYPNVPTIEGKKLLNDWAVRRAIWRTMNMYSFGSTRACLTPQSREPGSSSMSPAFSLRRRQS